MANPVVGSQEWFQAIGDGLLDGESGGPITDTQLAGYIGGLDTLSNAAVKLIANTASDAAKRDALVEFASTLTAVRTALVEAYTSGDTDTLQAAKDYADQHTGEGNVTTDELEEAIVDAKLVVNAYTDDQLNAANTGNKAYTDSQLQIIQSALQSYADTAGTNAVDDSRTYTDGRLETLTDGLSTVMDVKDQAILQEAKQYVIDHPGGGASSAYVDQGDSTTLTQGKTYADGVGDNRLAAAKAYADTKKTEAQTYADNKDVAVKAYADAQDVVTLNAAKADATAKSDQARNDGYSGALNYVNAKFTDTGWVALTASAGNVVSATTAYRVLYGIVYLRGQISKSDGSVIAASINGALSALPATARPTQAWAAAAVGSGSVGFKVIVNTSGTIDIAPPTTGMSTYVRLDNIQFPLG